MSDDARAQILAAFGVTEDDLAVLEAQTGYLAARAEAEREKAELWTRAQAQMRPIEEEFEGELDL